MKRPTNRCGADLRELLAGEAAGDLDASERVHLDAMEHPAANDERAALMATAAMVQLAFMRHDGTHALPDRLRTRLIEHARDWAGDQQPGRQR